MLGFPASMFPATTILSPRAGSFVKQEAGDYRPGNPTGTTIMGNVQDATAEDLTSDLAKTFKFDSIIYYPSNVGAVQDDTIHWTEANLKYKVVAIRQEACFGILWAVYCLRMG